MFYISKFEIGMSEMYGNYVKDAFKIMNFIR